MQIIGRPEEIFGKSKLEGFVDKLPNRGHFGSSENGVYIAILGNVEIPAEISAAIN